MSNGMTSMRTFGAASRTAARGILAKDTGHFEDSRRCYARALALMTGVLDPNAPELAGVHHNLAGLLHAQGRFGEAEPEALRALSLRALSDPPDPSGMAADVSVLGAVLPGEGRLDEAEDQLRTALQIWESLYGPDHYEVAARLNNLASIQQKGAKSMQLPRATYKPWKSKNAFWAEITRKSPLC